MKKKIGRGKAYKAELVNCSGGPFNGNKISMGLSQLNTLPFSIKDCDPGCYSRHSPSSNVATWLPEPKLILRKGATRGASL